MFTLLQLVGNIFGTIREAFNKHHAKQLEVKIFVIHRGPLVPRLSRCILRGAMKIAIKPQFEGRGKMANHIAINKVIYLYKFVSLST